MKKFLKSIVTTLVFVTVLMGCEEGSQMSTTEAENIEVTSATSETMDSTEETSETTNETTPHVHNYSISTSKEATCDEKGLLVFLCDCGDSYEEVVAQKTHVGSDWIISKEASCAEDGSKYMICTLCNADLETAVIEKTEHTPGEWQTVKVSTCTEQGEKIKKCTVCNEEVDKEKIKKTGHSVSDWTTIKEQNCRFDGIIVKQCTMCNMEFDRQVFPATGAHIPEFHGNPGVCTLCKTCKIVLHYHELKLTGYRKNGAGKVIGVYECEWGCGYKCSK